MTREGRGAANRNCPGAIYRGRRTSRRRRGGENGVGRNTLINMKKSNQSSQKKGTAALAHTTAGFQKENNRAALGEGVQAASTGKGEGMEAINYQGSSGQRGEGAREKDSIQEKGKKEKAAL